MRCPRTSAIPASSATQENGSARSENLRGWIVDGLDNDAVAALAGRFGATSRSQPSRKQEDIFIELGSMRSQSALDTRSFWRSVGTLLWLPAQRYPLGMALLALLLIGGWTLPLILASPGRWSPVLAVHSYVLTRSAC
ncbi:MAG: hypothetical protein IPO66_09085 [Rhodanobacteraceae bacterium]|nr:hypothetical protein [Rhodanobacteraceae bacterium]